MKPQYKPRTTNQKLGYLVEECGEVLAAVGKAQRWGLENFNPETPCRATRNQPRLDPSRIGGSGRCCRHAPGRSS
jgi:hypothetical protein